MAKRNGRRQLKREAAVTASGYVVVLNGVPRAGKTSIARELVAADSQWTIHGVDAMIDRTPPSLWPGIGLRPGGERPDLEGLVLSSYRALFDQVAELAISGRRVAVDVGLHDDYSRPLNIVGEMTVRLASVPVLLVGVYCSLEALRERRADSGYLTWALDEPAPLPVQRWQRTVHTGLRYDLEVDTTRASAAACASLILERIASDAASG